METILKVFDIDRFVVKSSGSRSSCWWLSKVVKVNVKTVKCMYNSNSNRLFYMLYDFCRWINQFIGCLDMRSLKVLSCRQEYKIFRIETFSIDR